MRRSDSTAEPDVYAAIMGGSLHIGLSPCEKYPMAGAQPDLPSKNVKKRILYRLFWYEVSFFDAQAVICHSCLPDSNEESGLLFCCLLNYPKMRKTEALKGCFFEKL